MTLRIICIRFHVDFHENELVPKDFIHRETPWSSATITCFPYTPCKLCC